MTTTHRAQGADPVPSHHAGKALKRDNVAIVFESVRGPTYVRLADMLEDLDP